MERSSKLASLDRKREQDNKTNNMLLSESSSKSIYTVNKSDSHTTTSVNDVHNDNEESSKKYTKESNTSDSRERGYKVCESRSQEKYGQPGRECNQSVSHDGINKASNARSHSKPVQSASSLHSNDTNHVNSSATSKTTICHREGIRDMKNRESRYAQITREMLSSAELSHVMHELNWCRANIINQMYELELMELTQEAIETERRKGAVIINDNLSLERLREQLTKIYAEYADSERPYVVMRMIDNALHQENPNNKSHDDNCNVCIDKCIPIVRAREVEESNNDLIEEPCHCSVETIVEELTNILETLYLSSHLLYTTNNNNNNNNNNSNNNNNKDLNNENNCPSSNRDESVHAAQTKIALLSYFRKFFEIGVRYVPIALNHLQASNTQWNYGKQMEIRFGEEEANVTRQLYLALIHNIFTFAFSCPCTLLQVAAQLVLAYSLAQRDEELNDDCFGILRYLPEIKRSCKSTSYISCYNGTNNIERSDGQGDEPKLHSTVTTSHEIKQNSQEFTKNELETQEMAQIQENSEKESERLQEEQIMQVSEREDNEMSKKEGLEEEHKQQEEEQQKKEKEKHQELEEKEEENALEQTLEKQNSEQQEKTISTKHNLLCHATSSAKLCNSNSTNSSDDSALDETKLREYKLCEEKHKQEQQSLHKLEVNHTLSEAHIRATDKLLWLNYDHNASSLLSSDQENNNNNNNNRGLESCSTYKTCKSHVRVMDIKRWLSLSAEAQSVIHNNDHAYINISVNNDGNDLTEEKYFNEANHNNNKNIKEIEEKNNNEVYVEGKAFLMMTPAITTALPVTDRVILRDDGHKLAYIKRYLELMLFTLEETQQTNKTQKRNMTSRRVSKNEVKELNLDENRKTNWNSNNNSGNNDNTNKSYEDKEEKSMVEKQRATNDTDRCSKGNLQLESEQPSEQQEQKKDENDDDTDEEVFTLNSTPRFNSPRRQRLRRQQSSHSRQNSQQNEKLKHRSSTPANANELEKQNETEQESHFLTQRTTEKVTESEKQVLPYFFHQNERKMRHLLRALLKCQYFTSPMQRRGSKEVLYVIYSQLDRCPGYCHLLSLFPELLHAHHASLSFTLFGDGPLPIDVRLMIGIMAASRHNCHSLVSRFATIMLHHYGDSRLEDEYVDEDILEMIQMEECELEKQEESIEKLNTFSGTHSPFRTEIMQRSMSQRFSSPTATRVNNPSLSFTNKYNKRISA